MLKILHAADFHLDSPFSSLSPERAQERRQEQRALFASLAELSVRESVQLVLLAGDLLDSAHSGLETSRLLTETLEAINAEVFIAAGNHDYLGPASPYTVLKFPKHVHIFDSSEIQSVELPGLGCTVWGASFTNETSPPLLSGFRAPNRGLNLMVLHGDVNMPRSGYNPVSEAEIGASSLDYLALGHVHRFGGVKRAGNTDYAYSGCPEGRGFDETGDKGVLLGTVSPGKTDLRFVPLGGRRYEVLEVDLSRAQDAAAAIAEAIPRDSGRDIYRIILRGEFDGELDIDRLTARFSERFFALTIRDLTRIKRDIWERSGEDTLRGHFLRSLRKKFEEAADDEQRERIVLAVRYGLSALDNGEEYRT